MMACEQELIATRQSLQQPERWDSIPLSFLPSVAFLKRQNKIPNPVNGWPDIVWLQFMREKMVHVGTVDAI
jgi:hypothetical protein